MAEITISLCSGRTAYEAKTHRKIDLSKADRVLKIKIFTKYLVIGEFNGAEISLYPSGRMLIKKVKDEEHALDTVKELIKMLDMEDNAPKE